MSRTKYADKFRRLPTGGPGGGSKAERKCHATDPDYTAEEVEFMTAMERYCREHGVRNPSCGEILAVAKALGYRLTDRKERA